MRAFFYSYLVSLYGDIPLILSTDYKSNSQVPRSPKSDVFKQIIADLKEAKNLLSEKYVAADIHTVTTERVRPTKWAAQALLARTYLYNAEWANAETEATALIGNSSTFSLSSLDGCFLKNSTEAIWQLQPVNLGANTEDARFFIIPATGFSGDNYPVYISSGLLNAFESTDQRKLKWLNKYTDATVTPQVDYYYPFKYKVNTYNAPVTEYLMVLRLAEQYLIRAEARARQGNVGGAQTDLNAIRHRAGLGDTPANDQNSLLDAILRERHVELFSEWGHRWFDLKRTGTIDAIMNIVTPQKGGTWNTNWQLYPLPLSEIQSNPNLKQNPSY